MRSNVFKDRDCFPVTEEGRTELNQAMRKQMDADEDGSRRAELKTEVWEDGEE